MTPRNALPLLALALVPWLAPPAGAQGMTLEATLPPGTHVVSERAEGARLEVELALPQGFLASRSFDEPFVEDAVRAFLARYAASGVRAVRIVTRDRPGRPARPLVEWLPEPPKVPVKINELHVKSPYPPPPPPPTSLFGVDAPGQTAGFLSGRTVYVSQGHGFYWSDTLGRWATQRGNTHGLVEDLLNAEAANHYLVQLLANAGARVVTLRERDMQTHLVLIDDGGGAPGYTETGAGWKVGASKGFAADLAPYVGDEQPFALGGYRVAPAVQGKATASAIYVPDIPEEGDYAVYLAWTSSDNRVQDAHYEIRHTGGVTHLRVDQEHHGWTWNHVGVFHFAKGIDPQSGAVVLWNDTEQDATDQWVVADAVRLGGGMGDFDRGGKGAGVAKGPLSNRPRWEECSRYYCQYLGAPSTVYDYSTTDNNDDVSARSRCAAWDHETGEDAVFVSWHTNAPSPGRGTSTYVYGPNEPDGTYQFAGAKGSDELAKALHAEIVNDVRQVFDPKWKDLGIFSAWFGELNPKHNDEMPSTLVEVAFHDTLADADYLREPRFRFVVARAFYQGIVKYFAKRDSVAPKLVPEPPAWLTVVSNGPTTAKVRWGASPTDALDVGGDAATTYRVYLSKDGRGFDGGTEVTGTEWTLEGLAPGDVRFVRVSALNGGGESFPTATLGLVKGCDAGAAALFVQGFSRLDATQLPVEDLSAYGDGQVQRLAQRKMNRFDYAIEHLQALGAAGLSVDAIDHAAFSQALVPLGGYALIDWAAGEQSSADGTLAAADRAALGTWLGAGGHALLASGSELAWDLGTQSGPEAADWLATWFRAALAGDAAGTYATEASEAGGPLGALDPISFDDGTQGTYDVNSADLLAVVAGGQAVLSYAQGKGVAAVYFDGGTHKNLLLGFPFETVHPAAARAALMAKMVGALGAKGDLPPCSGSGSESDATSADGGETAADGSDAGPVEDAPPADAPNKADHGLFDLAGEAGTPAETSQGTDAAIDPSDPAGPDIAQDDVSLTPDGTSGADDTLAASDGGAPGAGSGGGGAAESGCSAGRGSATGSGSPVLLGIAMALYRLRKNVSRSARAVGSSVS